MMNRLQQLAATAEAHSSYNSIIHPTASRAGMSNPVPSNHTEKEREAAATILTLCKSIVYSKQDIEAAYILLAINEPDRLSGSDGERTITDGERTITDGERTITAEPTPVATPTRPAPPPTPILAPTQACGGTSVLPNTATTSIRPPLVKKISLEEYVAMKKSRKDQRV